MDTLTLGTFMKAKSFCFSFLLIIIPYQVIGSNHVLSSSLKSKKSLFSYRENYKKITLQEAVSQGLLSNQDEKIREYREDILDIDYKNNHDQFWWPSLKIEATTLPHRIGSLSTSENDSTRSDKFPKGSLGFSIDNYTLFNWGKDYLEFLNKKEDYHRSKQKIKEERRELEHDIIVNYFKLLTLKKVAKIGKKNLRFFSFIYRFNRERLSLKKIKNQEFLESRGHYLEAQEFFQNSFHKARLGDQSLAELLNDSPGTKYILKSKLIFKKLQTPLEESLKLSLELNSKIKDAKVSLKNTHRNYEKTLREILPLPKISLNLGTYKYFFGRNESVFRYEAEEGNSNIDVVATLNASWTILGEGGFFNQRTLKKSTLNQNLAYKKLQKEKISLKRKIGSLYYRLLFLQKMIPLLQSQVKNLDKTFSETLENYRDGKTTLIQFKNALQGLTKSQIKLETFLFEHLQKKFILATEMGVDFIPGENISLLSREKGDD